MTTISVLTADDHVVVRRGPRAMLEGEPGARVVGEAAVGRAVTLITKSADGWT